MDSNYQQTRTWMNSRGANNTSSTSWVGFLSERDPEPERSSISLAGWSQYENTSRRPLMSNDILPAPQRSAGSRWSRDQPEWNAIRGGGPPAALNSWSGPSNGNPRVMQNQPQQQQPVPKQSNVLEPPKRNADGFLQGFNSAGRDWFYRYLNMGCSPEEARDRVLERNRNHPESLDSTARGGRFPDAKAQVDRRNPTSERRRPVETGSEAVDNVLNTLNGACLKWYNKHLENGFTPEEAIAKVLEHRRTFSGKRPVQSSTDSGGRKRSVESKPKEDPKKPKRGNESFQAETVNSGKDHLAVAVVADDYPNYYLMKSELTKIENALLEEMKNGWTRSLNFGGLKYRPGMMVLTCMDEGSKEWLEQVVPKITAVQGVPLRIYKEDEVLNFKGITFYVPRSVDEPDDVTLRFVKEQNTDLLSGNWAVVRSSLSRSKNGKVMTLRIGEKSLDLLNKRGMAISYRFVQLPCHISKGPLFLPSKKQKEVDETPVNPPEIDLTAEDEDIEFSEMTVLDEVHCDDDDGNEADEMAEEDENGNGEYEQQGEEENEQ
ncbi:hypothetical protein KR200_003010 [Drosophila serrata]|nr:hypothetical protein KR200_003010 [Drosophila serrata]